MKYSDIKLVILAAGNSTRLYPLTLGFPKCLLSVNQKPMIFNMLTPMIRQGLKDVTIVVNVENKSLIESFISHSFSISDVKFSYIIQEKCLGPAYALKLAIKDIDKPVMLLCSDTICEIPKNLDYNFIGVSRVTDNKEDYCMVEYNTLNEVTRFFDKDKKNNKKYEYASIGIYYLKNYELLKELSDVSLPLINNEEQLSSFFLEYMKTEKIYIENFCKWEDIGTLELYKKVCANKFNCRYFNDLSLSDIGIITKESTYEKIKSEIEWFRANQKNDFGKMSPRFYDYGIDAMKYDTEYYDYLTLMEYLCYYPLTDYNIKSIFNSLFSRLFKIYQDEKKVIPDFKIHTEKILLDKTSSRLYAWNRKDLLAREKITINGKSYFGITYALDILNESIHKICDETDNYTSIVHGDPTFSNILFSPRMQLFKFIDPRGYFDIDTVYGDTRYDIAKLRHCFHGRYDEIINDLFEVEEDVLKGEINYKFYKKINYKIFDNIIKKEYNIDDIELIEGLLFISMLPLHNDYPLRQLVFFARGIECLNHQIMRRDLC